MFQSIDCLNFLNFIVSLRLGLESLKENRRRAGLLPLSESLEKSLLKTKEAEFPARAMFLCFLPVYESPSESRFDYKPLFEPRELRKSCEGSLYGAKILIALKPWTTCRWHIIRVRMKSIWRQGYPPYSSFSPWGSRRGCLANRRKYRANLLGFSPAFYHIICLLLYCFATSISFQFIYFDLPGVDNRLLDLPSKIFLPSSKISPPRL